MGMERTFIVEGLIGGDTWIPVPMGGPTSNIEVARAIVAAQSLRNTVDEKLYRRFQIVELIVTKRVVE